MIPLISGIHHVTAIASDPQRNMDFYAGTLGLRLVKLTVNFDDPGTYHLYYGDGVGRPGTIMTFFPWPGAPRGTVGLGQVGVTAFAVPTESLGFWRQRLEAHGVKTRGPAGRFGEQVLEFDDPDGLPLELVAGGSDARPGWDAGPVKVEHAIRGFHSVALAERPPRDASERTLALLGASMDFRLVAESGDRLRYAMGDGSPGALVDVLLTAVPQGRGAAGTVHHVAWRTPDDAHQAAWRERIAAAGLDITPVRDRQYFRSVYFREPGGVLFEIATDPPGFATDESPEHLGERLRLPPWLEPKRATIERSLPPLRLPQAARRD
jgi:glyoxalase family protein